jgi:hypothetical protein
MSESALFISRMIVIVQIGIAVSAFAAAIFWWLSARTPAPPATWKGIDQLPKWLDNAAALNRRAAMAAAVSAALTAVAMILGWLAV